MGLFSDALVRIMTNTQYTTPLPNDLIAVWLSVFKRQMGKTSFIYVKSLDKWRVALDEWYSDGR